jgi:hypothetical protein
VACLIRLFLRYIVEVEALTTKGFTKVQSSCYIKTLEVGSRAVAVCGVAPDVACDVVGIEWPTRTCRCEPRRPGIAASTLLRWYPPHDALTAYLSSPFAASLCVQAIQSHLLPSLRRMIGACFFAEGVNSLHASPSVRTML